MAKAAVAETSTLTLPSQRIARFFARHLVHGKGQFAGRPFVLEPWQLHDVVEPVFDPRRPDGRRIVQEALVGVPKKNGKTHTAAGFGAYLLVADGYVEPGGRWVPEYGAEVYNVAGSKDQAKVLFEIGSGFVLRDPVLRSMCRVYRDAIEVKETESVWRVMAADGKLAHGPNPSAAIIDEIWVHKNPELYEAFASAGAARRQPLLLTITTAGYDTTSIAHALYRRGLKGGGRGFYFKWFAAPDTLSIDDPKGWAMANPSRWITSAYLKKELKRSKELGLESEFRRFHLNQWTSGKENAFPVALWDGGAGRPNIKAGAEVVIGVDTAPKRDHTAIALVHKDAKGIHHARVTKMQADPATGYLDYDALEDILRELCRRYNVTRILVDPYNMVRSMLTLADEGLPIEEFPQGDSRMVPASMNLYELLAQNRLRHGGDKELRDQAMSASKRVATSDRGWRLQKRTSSGIIDGIVALAIACYELERGGDVDAPPTPALFV